MSKVVLALGYFDGLHLGHKSLLNSLKTLAGKYACKCGVFTFGDDFYPSLGLNIKLIDTELEKTRKLISYGIDFINYGQPTLDFLKMSGDDFEKYLLGNYNLQGICVGEDFRYGKNAEKSVNDLTKFCKANKIVCHIESIRFVNDEKISSSKIRELIKEGQVSLLPKILGEKYSLSGIVEKGRGEGRKFGIRTANISVNEHKLLPKEGVYSTITFLERQAFSSLTHIGECPTFNYNKLTVETLILNFDEDIYSWLIRIEFVKRMRSNISFNNSNDLKNQIIKDIEEVTLD